MVFSTPFFLTVFLPVALAVAFVLSALGRRWWPGARWRWVNVWLLAASLGFYFLGEGPGTAWLVASIVLNAACARAIDGGRARRPVGERWRKAWLAAAMAGNLALLGVFKYAGLAARTLDLLPGMSVPIPQIALPLGISFYTFQAMSYVIDVYRREVAAARRTTDFACYLALFPQLVAGPIVRYADIQRQLDERETGLERVASGAKRFLCGLAKKVLVANTVAAVADAYWGVVEDGGALPAGMAWVALVCYTLQIYYDFSGYSDMAIGMGRMLGFDFRENFLHPYSATSVQDFWRKWHVSLSTWFRDYLYIPLGGNRKGPLRAGLNGLVVFALCGLWHGASWTFMAWGLWHGAFLLVERCFRRKPARAGNTLPLRGKGAETRFHCVEKGPKHVSIEWKRVLRSVPGRVYALAVVMAGWVLFRSECWGDAWRFLGSLAGVLEPVRSARALWLEFSPKAIWALAAGVLLAFPVVPAARGWLRSHVPAEWASAAEWAVLTLLGLAALLMVAGGAYNPFIYYRF